MRSSTKPKVVLILQARMGSTRLPGKSMMPLAGVPLVGRILERVKRSEKLDEIVLATTQKDEDDVLTKLSQSYGIPFFRGSENDLVDRYFQCAKEFNADIIARLPADNPVPEPREIDRIVDFHLTGQSDFSSNLAEVLGNGYPDGIGAEVFNRNTLEEIWHNCIDPQKREHLHLNYFDYKAQKAADPEHYRVATVVCPEEFRRPDLVLDVNTIEEYNFMSELYDYLYPRNSKFHITDIIQWYDNIYIPNKYKK
jgi:spore coat polysaccharide biosynthesis protein SpsF